MKRSKLLKQTKEQISDTLRLPKDLAKGEALVSITGQEEAFIENYKGILECTDVSVVIATGRCRIRFQGKHLHVEYYTNEEMKIEGMIQKILFL